MAVVSLSDLNAVRFQGRRRARVFLSVPLIVTSILLGWLAGEASARAEQLQEVTVTANRRDESNQRVPLGIVALSADTADKVGVTDAQSLAALVPGLLFNTQA